MNTPLSLKAKIATSSTAIRLAGLINGDQSLTGSNFKYKRFVVASYQRSGSTMLTSALNSHPDVICYSEIYNIGRPMFMVDGMPENSNWLKKIRDIKPTDFLSRIIFRGYSPAIKSVGFKFFPEHLRHNPYSGVLNKLIDDKSISCIHLIRRNQLAMYLSLVKAQRTGAWSSNKKSNHSNELINLDPYECQKAFESIKHEQEYFIKCLENRDVLTVYYEDIIESPDEKYNEVQSFIGLDIQSITPTIKKQIVKPLSQIIENYNELKEHFSDTEWKNNFDQ
jgi:LPS sulfotransferase NodH